MDGGQADCVPVSSGGRRFHEASELFGLAQVDPSLSPVQFLGLDGLLVHQDDVLRLDGSDYAETTLAHGFSLVVD